MPELLQACRIRSGSILTCSSVGKQIENLVRWLAAQARDDHLGAITLPGDEALAAIIGAVDGARVRRLMQHAVGQKLIEIADEQGVVHLTADAWTKFEVPPEPDQPTEIPGGTPDNEVVPAHCNNCGGERSAFRRESFTKRGNDEVVSWADTYEILECCGCGKLSIRHEVWFSEWDDFGIDTVTGEETIERGVRVSYWPAQATRPRPDWIDSLEDEALRNILDEVYTALDHDLLRLATTGTRTALDRAMYLRIGDPRNGFRGKLDAMVEAGRIGDDERQVLQIMTDAGNATAHRGHIPSRNTLEAIIDTVENFLQRDFILTDAAGAVRDATPPRPARG